MTSLPSGTVTLLFSDMEGSTRLLSQLGASYAEALDGQREVLRTVWARHGGTELGTEGDSFYVAFPDAPRAVAAASEGQRDLDAHGWPQGADVRVRIGIHTGTPVIHDDGYVGMDVHRAARIAGAAHGGQVVVSAATAQLVERSLPDGVGLRDLGRHQLKDLPAAEHLFQLVVDGLRADFPPLKSLGASTSLPTPATSLVGRDGELATLEPLLRTDGVRLLTLTGPGGAGKTRLAIALAQALVDAFPEGVYFAPLAAVTSPGAMWSTIGEVLDLPAERRSAPGLVDDLAHRHVLLVLDNLEQLDDADSVVAELLTGAPDTVVIATSRRPLHIRGEHEHPVPPLVLASAVELFVQIAKRVRPSFELNDDNSADVAALCRRLDGLPLAMELVAARTKLLSPRALLARLDTALDFRAADRGAPRRQKTLRDTIAWSYQLLTAEEQRWFRRLGVFAGGADLDAVSAVVGDTGDADVLYVVAALVDASLVLVSEGADGEPRVGLLETVRAYAREQLAQCDEVDDVRARHTGFFLRAAERRLESFQRGGSSNARAWCETELDNIRASLDWALEPAYSDRWEIGARLCAALRHFWNGGYWIEGRFWLERVVASSGPGDRPELADCLGLLARCLGTMGEFELAERHATAAVEMCRRLPGEDVRLVHALPTLAVIEQNTGRLADARSRFEEALALARRLDDKDLLQPILGYFAVFESIDGDEQRSLELDTEALEFARDRGDTTAVLIYQHNLACSLRMLGRVQEAADLMFAIVPELLKLRDPSELLAVAEDSAAIVADLGRHEQAARLLAAADALRARLRSPRLPWQQEEIGEAIEKARAGLTEPEWGEAYQSGLTTPVEVVLAEAFEV